MFYIFRGNYSFGAGRFYESSVDCISFYLAARLTMRKVLSGDSGDLYGQ